MLIITLAIPSLCYAFASGIYIKQKNYGMAWVFAAYSLSLIGFIWEAK